MGEGELQCSEAAALISTEDHILNRYPVNRALLRILYLTLISQIHSHHKKWLLAVHGAGAGENYPRDWWYTRRNCRKASIWNTPWCKNPSPLLLSVTTQREMKTGRRAGNKRGRLQWILVHSSYYSTAPKAEIKPQIKSGGLQVPTSCPHNLLARWVWENHPPAQASFFSILKWE